MHALTVSGKPAPVPGKADRRTAICDAVFELLGEVGYDRMSMDAVAARAHASKATIYRSWPSKPDLVVAAILHRFANSSAPPNTGSLRGDLVDHLTAACVVANSADGDVMTGLLTAAAQNADLARTMQHWMYEAKRSAYDLMVGRAVARGELTGATDVALLHELVHGMVMARRVWETGPLDAAFVDRVVDGVLLPVLRHRNDGSANGGSTSFDHGGHGRLADSEEHPPRPLA